MARVIRDEGAPAGGPVLSNPSFLGVDLGTGAEIVAGMVGTALVNDKIVAPLTDGFVAGFRTANNTFGQVIDGVTTIGSAWLLSKVAKMVLSARTAQMMLLGGGSLGVSKAVAGFVPGLSISARYPDILGGVSIFGAPKAALAAPTGGAPTALGAGIPSAAPGLTTIRTRGMGY